MDVVAGRGRACRWSTGSDALRVGVDKPGLYRVTLPPVDGYVAPPFVDVTAVEGELVEVFVDLERAP